MVEILTDKKQMPNKDWLQLVKTAQATRVIRNFLRKSGIFLL
jgi:(p)ppGpp synthase/HD superfamily hydrolase